VIHPLTLWQLARHVRGAVSPDTAGRPPHRDRRSSAVRPHDQATADDVAVRPPAVTAASPPVRATRPMTAPCDVPNCVGHRTRA
jgi:hypothetical protein